MIYQIYISRFSNLITVRIIIRVFVFIRVFYMKFSPNYQLEEYCPNVFQMHQINQKGLVKTSPFNQTFNLFGI